MNCASSPWVGRVEPIVSSPVGVAYFTTDRTVADIGAEFGCFPTKISRLAGECRYIGMQCRACGGDITDKSRSEITSRLAALSSTYGWSRRKHDALACKECERAESHEAMMRRYGAPRTGNAPQVANSIEQTRALAAMPYAEYLATSHWQERRQAALKRAGYACQVCYANTNLHVHHRTYANRGREHDADLTVLCAECHALFHERMKLAEHRAPASQPDRIAQA